MSEQANHHDLLQRVAGGDREAFRQLFDAYQPRLIHFVTRLIRRDDLAGEIVNDTLLVVWQKAGTFRGQSRVSTWVMGIAYRLAMKRLRGVKRTAGEEPLPAELQLVGDGPDSALDRRQQDARVREALTKLTPEHRAVMELTFFHGFSYYDIARILDCPENTVKTRMFHARRRLKRLLSTLEAASSRSRIEDCDERD